MGNKKKNIANANSLRIKAEELLKDKQKNTNIPVKETDIKKLVHELQVHQIELEMQNEELRLANETAEAALKKYTMLYDLAPMGYFTLDSDGNIHDLNFTGADIIGERRITLMNSNFKLLVSQESLPVFNRFFSKVYSSNAKESCQVILVNDKKQLCYVYLEGVVTGEDKQCLLSVVDITNFKKS